MILDSINPSWLFFAAGFLTLAAAFVSEVQQRKSTADLRQQLELNTNLVQEMAATTGNDARLQEVIDLRRRLLETNRSADKATIDEIFAKVPQLTEDYRALNQNQTSAAERRLAAYRATWEPLIQFVIGEFDGRIAEVMAREPGVTLRKDDAFIAAGLGQAGGNSQLIRVAAFRGVELRLYCVSARTDPGDLFDGNLTITVRVPSQPENYSNPLSLPLRVPEPNAAARAEVSQAMADAAVKGINQGISDLLVVGKGA